MASVRAVNLVSYLICKSIFGASYRPRRCWSTSRVYTHALLKLRITVLKRSSQLQMQFVNWRRLRKTEKDCTTASKTEEDWTGYVRRLRMREASLLPFCICEFATELLWVDIFGKMSIVTCDGELMYFLSVPGTTGSRYDRQANKRKGRR